MDSDLTLFSVCLALFYAGILFLIRPSKEQRAYQKAEKFPLECIWCKQAKTCINTRGEAYRTRTQGFVTIFSKREATYCYVLKKRTCDIPFRCGVPITGNSDIDDAFIKDNKIEPYHCTPENAGKTVFISLSGRKYHTFDCQQTKARKWCTTVSAACYLGYSPCSKCNPPK